MCGIVVIGRAMQSVVRACQSQRNVIESMSESDSYMLRLAVSDAGASCLVSWEAVGWTRTAGVEVSLHCTDL